MVCLNHFLTELLDLMPELDSSYNERVIPIVEITALAEVASAPLAV